MEHRVIKNENLKDIFAGLVTAFCVSPTNAIFDRSVIQFANGKQTIQAGVKNGAKTLFFKPHKFFTSFQFKWMYFVYTITYVANNLTDHSNIIANMSIPIQNLLITFVSNSSTGIMKDKAYIQKFGVVQPKPFPMRSLGLLLLRDIIGVASAFTLPPIFSKLMSQKFDITQRKSRSIAQIFTPLFIQLFVTPIHLLGLDLYNNQGISFSKRLANIRRLYRNTVIIRMIRFLPAFGIGGVLNIQLRRALKDN